MNTFSKAVVGVVAGAALFAVAPGANAATTKTLSVKVEASAKAVNVTVNGSAKCRSLPAHGDLAYVTVPGVTLKANDVVSVRAFSSPGCTGSVTGSISNVTVSPYPLPNVLHLDVTK